MMNTRLGRDPMAMQALFAPNVTFGTFCRPHEIRNKSPKIPATQGNSELVYFCGLH